ncbi:hypothetical protein VNI00_017204 [Paramarasmius palmivorus]|uniref:Uncharacterized protein n=1 Tax=Paramarasmius palmivorus TaxID=297713 RepID=A0AAW0B6U5_9AGAR
MFFNKFQTGQERHMEHRIDKDGITQSSLNLPTIHYLTLSRRRHPNVRFISTLKLESYEDVKSKLGTKLGTKLRYICDMLDTFNSMSRAVKYDAGTTLMLPPMKLPRLLLSLPTPMRSTGKGSLLLLLACTLDTLCVARF